MNSICEMRKVLGVWLVRARTPGGAALLVNCKGGREAALEKARRAGEA